MTERNWAGNLVFGAARVAVPTSAEEVRSLVVGAGPRSLHALGTRHSFNDIADTTGTLVSTGGLGEALGIEVDEEARTVTVGAGIRYGVLARELEARGWALANLASLPHISVAGAVATATHGSGIRNGSLASSVAGLELIDGTGEVVTLRRGDESFDGAVVSLGVLGIATRITLDIEPSYTIEQTVYRGLPLTAVLEDFERVIGLGYSVSLFTTWREPDTIDQLWLKRRPDRDEPAPAELLGALPSDRAMHPIAGVSAVHCTEQLGVPGPWLDRLPHFKLEFTPSNGEELQSEYLVPRDRAVAALRELRAISNRIAPLLQVNEVREVAADELWLSSSYRTDVVGLHFTWLPDQAAVDALLPQVEERLMPLGARPHWGKRFTLDAAAIAPLYPRFDDFLALVRRHDPRGVFRNAYTDRVLGL